MPRSRKDERRTPRWKVALLWLGQWAVFFASWLVFVGKLERDEVLAGIVAAAVAATGSHVAWATHLARFSAHLSWIAQAWRLPLSLVTDTWEVLGIVLRHLFTRHKAGSVLRAVPYEACGSSDDEAALRALAITFTNITPSFVVVGIDRERGVMLVHQLRPGPISKMTRKLGAKP